MPLFTGQDIYDAIAKAGIDPVQVEKINKILNNLRKDSMPAAGRPMYGSRMFENGPFGLVDTEITSHVVSGGSPLMNWLPTKRIKDRTAHVSHLDFVAPEGFTGEETYPEWLASIELGECGYGPSTTWSGFSYTQSGGSFSWTTSMMKPYEDGGMRYFEEQPQYTVRGGFPNTVIDNDADWAVARVLHAAETHLDYVLKHGDEKNSAMEWDGLDQILRPGYVASRIYGSGVAGWADPVWINGAAITDPAALLQNIRIAVRVLRRRIRSRNWSLLPGDMVVYMSQVMWDNIAEHIAAGAAYAYTNAYGFDGQMNFRDFRAELRDIKSGGLGFGTIDIDGEPIPVMTDLNMGANTQLNTGSGAVDAITGNVQILTRRAGGMTLLEQQYVNWTDLNYPAIGENQQAIQNGIARVGWVTEANKCYYYYLEMAGRVIVRMMPLQAVIANATIPVLSGLENEAGAFYSENYYAFGGQPGGQGNVLLNHL